MTTSSLVTLPRSALAEHASPAVSSRYVFVDTRQVVRVMADEGFEVTSALSARTRSRDPLYSKHVLRFRQPDAQPVHGSVPEILFTNAHDRGAAASFMAGVFRFVCSNGLVVGSTYAKERVIHAGEAARNLIDRIRKLSANTGPLFEQVHQWTKKELTQAEQKEFAACAAVLRWGDAQRFDPAQLLAARRNEDKGDTLWCVFNRIQENAMAGDHIGYSADGRQLRSRPVGSVNGTLGFNQQLWRLAEEFA